ncbi:hypothetical protein [uncultured Clostridium sp.]|uniref:hypothetical protein n=1 Tax=uncultured Clostridium sp. TaxID=59620 RepID=UPI0028EAFDAA|nr:hypothetical protein [uncultured Clostridium sp.]
MIRKVMKNKNWEIYIVYSTLITVFIFLCNYITQKLTLQYRVDFSMSQYLIMGLPLIINFCFGFILGLEHLVKEIKKEGVRKLNIPKSIFIGIPSLYFSLTLFIYYSNISHFPFRLRPLEILATSRNNLTNLFQILLGYTTITSFYKNNEEINISNDF